jgi:hypothetical protein
VPINGNRAAPRASKSGWHSNPLPAIQPLTSPRCANVVRAASSSAGSMRSNDCAPIGIHCAQARRVSASPKRSSETTSKPSSRAASASMRALSAATASRVIERRVSGRFASGFFG